MQQAALAAVDRIPTGHPDGNQHKQESDMAGIGEYMQEVGKEMRKVTWPTQKELVSSTVVTIVASIVIALFIFATDRVISTVLEVIYG